MAKIVALLDSMWNWQGYHDGEVEAAPFFRINPDNQSGRRLYRLCKSHDLYVTNSCQLMQSSANHHGIPDPTWVEKNLKLLQPFDLLLVCGRVAKMTFAQLTLSPADLPPVILMDHPAARRWSNLTLDATAAQIERTLWNG